MDLPAHQRGALAELVEWWEDLADCSTGSQLVFMAVPPGWGRTTVLDALDDHITADEQRTGVVVRIDGGEAPPGLAMQIAWVEGLLGRQRLLPELRRALGVSKA